MTELPPVQAAEGTLGLEPRPGRLLAECSYLGAFFQGWQLQAKGERTVQGEIEGSSSGCTNARCASPWPAAPTPSYPPASSSSISTLRSPFPWGPSQGDEHPPALGCPHPSDLGSPAEFDARTSAVSKTYVYRLQRGGVLSPFDALTVHLWHGRLDADRMRAAARLIPGSVISAPSRSIQRPTKPPSGRSPAWIWKPRATGWSSP